MALAMCFRQHFAEPQYEPNIEAFNYSRQYHVLYGKTNSDANLIRTFAEDPMAWNGKDLGDSLIILLNNDEISEIVRTGHSYASSGRTLHDIDHMSFPLPLLSSRLERARKNLHSGQGIVLLRGLRPQQFDRRTNVVVFAGLSAHLSRLRGRQAARKCIVHVKEVKDTTSDLRRVAPYSNRRLPYHTDMGDVVSMYVLCAGTQGGEGTFASVSQICKVMAEHVPELVGELLTPKWPFHTPGQPDAVSRRPLLYLRDGKAEMNFSRGSLANSPSSKRSPNLPQMTSKQYEALEWVHWISEENSYRLAYQEGDMLFFNNRRILHGREAFADDISSGGMKSRHFLRLWLQDEELAGSPPLELRELWQKVFDDLTADKQEDADWPLEPISNEADAIPKWYLNR